MRMKVLDLCPPSACMLQNLPPKKFLIYTKKKTYMHDPKILFQTIKQL